MEYIRKCSGKVAEVPLLSLIHIFHERGWKYALLTGSTNNSPSVASLQALMQKNKVIIGITPTKDGLGYLLELSDGTRCV